MTHSYSKISLYERCPQAYEYRYIMEVPEKKSAALENGIKQHDLCERYLKGKLKRVPKSLSKIGDRLKHLKENDAVAEEWWNYTKNWTWSDKGFQWLVAKLDAYYFPDDSTIEIVDFKTGKKYKAAVRDQLSLYAVCALQTFKVSKVHAVADYIDSGTQFSIEWFIEDLPILFNSWRSRLKRLDAAKEFPTKPGFYCSFCSFHKDQGGPCQG